MKKITIIGGGIAGLSAGIYAQKYGFTSTIYEQHTIVGGECTGWNRQGYHIDNCIDWLTGTDPSSTMYSVWKELGALTDDSKLFCPESHIVMEIDGQKVSFYTDFDRLTTEFIRIAPEDEPQIRELIQDMRTIAAMEIPVDRPIDMLSPIELMKLGTSMKDIFSLQKKYSGISCVQLSERFSNPILKQAIAGIMSQYYSAFTFLFSLGTVARGNGSIPAGGSRALIERMRKQYETLGGTVITGMKVESILFEKTHATGIRLANQEEVSTDYIIAACDVKYTFETLLHNEFHDATFDKLFADTKRNPIPTSTHVSFGVDMDLKDYPTVFSFGVEPFRVATSDIGCIAIRNYAYEPSFAPEGKTIINVHISQWDEDYLWWKDLYQDKDAYNAYKKELAQKVQTRIEQKLPEWAGKLTLLDTYTPMTYERFCNTYHGGWMSFILAPGSKSIMHSGKIKGLGNCFLAGMWLQPPGGTPISAVTGKYAVQRICKAEGKPY